MVFPTFAMPCAQTRKVVQLSGEPRPYCDESSTLISLIDDGGRIASHDHQRAPAQGFASGGRLSGADTMGAEGIERDIIRWCSCSGLKR